ncbi:hypothetical protein GOBAR_DD29026 [Gossypium barbadense]|nr:hypothetical protein GOBAR_DD29026 [Gossypium barbadense]
MTSFIEDDDLGPPKGVNAKKGAYEFNRQWQRSWWWQKGVRLRARSLETSVLTWLKAATHMGFRNPRVFELD